ncbi:MAG: DUF559 domain-containing protein [Bacteroidia bacterium]|nr:DUF559 domain-containing protein [Bacteroidia bacterium]
MKQKTVLASNSPLKEGCPQDRVSFFDTPNRSILEINGITIKPFPILKLPYNPKLKERAKTLRQARNLPEVLFWKQVTKGGFHKIDFDRQRVIGNYIVDFYIKQLGLVIEIDGTSHIGKEEYDNAREIFLLSLNLKIYRITVGDILNNMTKTLTELEGYIIKNYNTSKH